MQTIMASSNVMLYGISIVKLSICCSSQKDFLLPQLVVLVLAMQIISVFRVFKLINNLVENAIFTTNPIANLLIYMYILT